MLFCLYSKTSGTAVHLPSEVWKKQRDVLCCMRSLYLFWKHVQQNSRIWNCMFLLRYQFFGRPFRSQNLLNVYCDETYSQLHCSLFFKGSSNMVNLSDQTVTQFMSTPLLQVDQSFHFANQGKPFEFWWMRRRGRVAFASPVVLGGPVKSPVTVVHFVSAISCAFFAGAAFIIWLLLAWAINSLCIGPILTWLQNKILNVGKPQTFGSLQWSSVSAV